MIRLIVCALVAYAASVLISRAWPESGQVWFSLAGWGVTYLLVACLVAGFIAWRVTK